MAARALPDDVQASPTRGRILTVAVRLFAQRGYAGTSMRDIAAESQIRAASIYEYFDGKDALLHEAMLELLSRFHNHILDGLDVDATPEHQLRHIVYQHVSWQLRFADIAAAWDIIADTQRISQTLPAELSDQVEERRQPYIDLVTALVTTVQPGPSARLRAGAVLSLCDRVAHWGSDYIGREPFLRVQAWALARAVITAGVTG
jgi:AcrR family transcriptional regulator